MDEDRRKNRGSFEELGKQVTTALPKLAEELPPMTLLHAYNKRYPTRGQWGPFSVGYNFKIADTIIRLRVRQLLNWRFAYS